VDVRLHVTFVALLALLVVWELSPTASGGISPAVLLALFGLAGLHELGHALVAKRLGVEVQDILVLPIVLMVRLRLPERARTELAVAAAGPAVNLVLAGAMLLALPPLGVSAESLLAWTPRTFLGLVFWTNLLMGTVNLVPAFPMDGGRVLRAAIALRADYLTATRIAMIVGWVVVVIAGSIAILATGSLVFALLAVFLVILGRREEEGVARRHRLRATRERLRACDLSGDGFPALAPWGDLRRLRDPAFRDRLERTRQRLGCGGR
jgi:stage IV sporulation protein FB